MYFFIPHVPKTKLNVDYYAVSPNTRDQSAKAVKI